jgi:hypothetical protein
MIFGRLPSFFATYFTTLMTLPAPTMRPPSQIGLIVPMFTRGFVRSNFFLPMLLVSSRILGLFASLARSGGRDRTADTAIMSRLLYH